MTERFERLRKAMPVHRQVRAAARTSAILENVALAEPCRENASALHEQVLDVRVEDDDVDA